MNAFFYDGQIRRFLLQFIKAMSHFQVEFGQDRNGFTTLQTVPVMYGDPSRQAAQIVQGNTENALPTVPCIACYISAMDYARERVQEPYHVSKVHLRERHYDSTTDTWGHGLGDSFTVERAMPVPYKLTMKVDIWTSNTEQKLQLLEQMLPLFNPALEIQSTDNYIDWTSLSAIYLIQTSWSSRTVPAGAGGQIDIATLTFELPIWISLPVKVKKMGVIEKIINSMYDVNGDLVEDITSLSNVDLLGQQVLTPMNYGLVFYGNTLQLIQYGSQVTNPPYDPTTPWQNLLNVYGGSIQNGLTTVRLEQPNGNTVVGTVSMHPADPTLLLFAPFGDTIPSNTLPPINAIIDPFNMPVDPTYLTAVAGTRYLILHAIGSPDNLEPAIAWHGTDGSNLIAGANDIIEYDGTRWFVSFSASGQHTVKYVTNLTSGIQFKWDPTTQEWSKAIEGTYSPGAWTIVITA